LTTTAATAVAKISELSILKGFIDYIFARIFLFPDHPLLVREGVLGLIRIGYPNIAEGVHGRKIRKKD
jgi:hypothetical protein